MRRWRRSQDQDEAIAPAVTGRVYGNQRLFRVKRAVSASRQPPGVEVKRTMERDRWKSCWFLGESSLPKKSLITFYMVPPGERLAKPWKNGSV